MPYVNHIAYTSKSVNVSLFDFSQQLLQILKYRYWERCEMCVWRLPTKFEIKKKTYHTTSAPPLSPIQKHPSG